MKNIICITISLFLVVAFSQKGFSQELMEKMNEIKSTKYQDWVETFHNFYTDKAAKGQTDKSGTGYKQVARLLNYYRTRLDTDGNIVNTSLYNWRAYKDFVRQNQAQPFVSASPQTGNWSYGGPFNVRGLDNKVSGIGRIAFIKLDPNDAGNASQAVIYVGTPKGGLWKGIFNKTTGQVPGWTNISDGLPNIGASDLCISPVNRNIMYLVSGDKEAGVGTVPTGIGILKTTDGGITWLPTAYYDDSPPTFSYGNIRKLVMDNSNPLRMWAVTTAGIIRTTDGWATFTNEISGSFWDLEKGQSTSNQNLIACTSSRVYTSSDYGDTWTSVKQNSPNQALDYVFSGSRAQICVTEAFGSDRSFYLWYVSGTFNTTTSNIKLYAGSSNTWTDKYTGTDLVHVYVNYCMAFEGNPGNSNAVYAGGVGLKQSNDAGNTWSDLNQGVGAGAFSSGIHADQHFMAWDQGYLFLGNDGGVYNYNNSMGGWQYLSDGMYITQYYRLAYNNNVNGFQWLGGAQDNGTHRQSQHVGCCDGMEALINYNTPTTVYASFQGANVIRSTNSGDTWSDFFPPGFQNGDVWITPMAMHKTNPAIVALGQLSGSTGIIDIYNGSWSQKASTTGEFVWLAFAKSAPNVLYGITSSKIVKISDVTAASPTVTTTNLPAGGATSLTVDPNNSAHVFYTVGGYGASTKVYESTNSGATWTNISLNLPDVPVNCILMSESANDDVYIGTDIGVFVKLGTWNYWAPFMNGLPNTEITDMDIDGGLLTCATYGRGRWLTNLYGSCVPDLDLTPGNDPSNSYTTGDQYYTASDSISSTRIVTGGAGSNVTYRAGNSVTLKQGFHVKLNNEFLGMIGPCFPGSPAPLGGLYDTTATKPEQQLINVPSPKYDYMKPKF